MSNVRVVWRRGDNGAAQSRPCPTTVIHYRLRVGRSVKDALSTRPLGDTPLTLRGKAGR